MVGPRNRLAKPPTSKLFITFLDLQTVPDPTRRFRLPAITIVVCQTMHHTVKHLDHHSGGYIRRLAAGSSVQQAVDARECRQRNVDLRFCYSQSGRPQRYFVVMHLTHIRTINRLDIKRRNRCGRDACDIPMYSVYSPDGVLLKNFRRLTHAEVWAAATKDYLPKQLLR